MIIENFVNKGSDEALLKAISSDPNINQEELQKAIDKSKLVQVEVTVQGKNKTFTRKQWKRAGDVKSGEKIIGVQQPASTEENKSTLEIPKGNWLTISKRAGSDYGEVETKDLCEELGMNPDKHMLVHSDDSSNVDEFTKFKEDALKGVKTKDWVDSPNGVYAKVSVNGTKMLAINDGGYVSFVVPTENNKSTQKKEDKSKEKKTQESSAPQIKTPRDKESLAKLLQSGASRQDIMSQAEKDGVTWKKSDHEGINWMRACMAITGSTTRGAKKEEKKEDAPKKDKAGSYKTVHGVEIDADSKKPSDRIDEEFEKKNAQQLKNILNGGVIKELSPYPGQKGYTSLSYLDKDGKTYRLSLKASTKKVREILGINKVNPSQVLNFDTK